jgi:glutamine cyclotransferase
MSEKKTQTIVIDDIEHDTTNFTPEQILLTNHCLDLDRKIGSSQFQIQQLQVGKDAFVKMLKDSLEKPKE